MVSYNTSLEKVCATLCSTVSSCGLRLRFLDACGDGGAGGEVTGDVCCSCSMGPVVSEETCNACIISLFVSVFWQRLRGMMPRDGGRGLDPRPV